LLPSCNLNYLGYRQISGNKKHRLGGVFYSFSHGVPMRNNSVSD